MLVNVCLKMFVIDIFHVSGSSMNPTLQNGNYVVIYKCCNGIRLPRNVFEVPWIGTLAYYCTPNGYINQILDFSKDKMFNRLGNFFTIQEAIHAVPDFRKAGRTTLDREYRSAPFSS